MNEFTYPGDLELFAEARHWKTYWSEQVKPFIGGDILEVGAGIGSNTPILDSGGAGRWLCLEPDPGLFAKLTEALRAMPARRSYELVCGTLHSLTDEKFDTIIISTYWNISTTTGLNLSERPDTCGRRDISLCSRRRTSGCSRHSTPRSVTGAVTAGRRCVALRLQA